jgi:hypothetical protein
MAAPVLDMFVYCAVICAVISALPVSLICTAL